MPETDDAIPAAIAALPVQPRQWSTTARGKVRQEWAFAVMMPYPVFISEDALCRDDEEWTVDHQGYNAIAHTAHQKAVCASCTLRTACAEWGIAHEDYYVFGGLTRDERRVIRKRRGQALVDPLRARQFGLNIDGPDVSGWGSGASFEPVDMVEDGFWDDPEGDGYAYPA